MSDLPSILIIGCGSIGERHLRCFQRTGRCRVSACDTNATLLADMRARYSVPSHADYRAALVAGTFDGVIICTPANTHLAIACEALGHGAAVFIEKPLAVSLDHVETVRARILQCGRFVAVGYVYHHCPWVAQARDWLHRGALGRARHASVVAGQHFPTFRPAYRDIYYASRATGGGAIQDAATHLANTVEWMLGPATRVFCDASHQVLEGVSVEDTVNIAARHGEVLVSYALNQFQAPNEMTVQVHCENGSVKIEHHRQRWGVMARPATEWSWHESAPLERDDFFVAQAHAFLDGMEGKPTPLCTFEEAVQTLKFNLAALRSADTGLPITIA